MGFHDDKEIIDSGNHIVRDHFLFPEYKLHSNKEQYLTQDWIGTEYVGCQKRSRLSNLELGVVRIRSDERILRVLFQRKWGPNIICEYNIKLETI